MDALASLRLPFRRRVTTSPAWAWFAFGAPRWTIALALALAPVVVLLLLLLAPGAAGTLLSNERVRDIFSRTVPGLITAATLAVAFSALTMRRGLKGLGELHEHMSEDSRYRERAERALGRKELPLGVPDLLAVALDEVGRHAHVALGHGATGELREFLDITRTRAGETADAVRARRANPDDALAASLDFEHELTAHLARRFLRDDQLPSAQRGALEAMYEALETMALARSYLKTLATQRGLARMVQAIALSAFVGILVCAFVAMGYPEDAVGAWGFPVAAALVAFGLFAIALPVALFVSYTLRFVFLHEHTLPLGEFVLGPENRAVAEGLTDSTRGASARAPPGRSA